MILERFLKAVNVFDVHVSISKCARKCTRKFVSFYDISLGLCVIFTATC